jgi:hypothetical protein
VNDFTDNNSDAADPGSAHSGQLQDPKRRSFSRKALVGSAVVLSLGNRSAWGGANLCMSVATIASFDPTTGMFISAPAGRPDHNPDLAAEFHRISSAEDDYIGTGYGSNGNKKYSSCRDPSSFDSRCLVKGDSDKCP